MTDNASQAARTRALLDFGRQIDPLELFPTLNEAATELALHDPFAFALAVCLDRGTRAEIIWTIPYYIKERLGHLDPQRIRRMSEVELQQLFATLPHRPRYINAAPRTVHELAALVVGRFAGDASQMWRGKKAAEVRATFLSIYGVGPAIANMAVLLIEKAFGIRFTDLERPDINIKPDVHTMRVLYRLGLSSRQTPEAAIDASRRLHTAYPGELDAPLWIIGRRWCYYAFPNCRACVMNALCPKIGV